MIVFLQNFEKALLEILMWSSTFCLSWKIDMCSCTNFGSPRKDGVFLYKDYVFSWKIHMNTYDFPEERNTIRTDQIFQESVLKIL